ncbi:MAG: hypothetical protein MJ252_15595 [archaeon]|nr:hypothetical protein [archaeon]
MSYEPLPLPIKNRRMRSPYQYDMEINQRNKDNTVIGKNIDFNVVEDRSNESQYTPLKNNFQNMLSKNNQMGNSQRDLERLYFNGRRLPESYGISEYDSKYSNIIFGSKFPNSQSFLRNHPGYYGISEYEDKYCMEPYDFNKSRDIPIKIKEREIPQNIQGPTYEKTPQGKNIYQENNGEQSMKINHETPKQNEPSKENFMTYQNRENSQIIQQNINRNYRQPRDNRGMKLSQSMDFSRNRPNIRNERTQPVLERPTPHRYEVNNFSFPEDNIKSENIQKENPPKKIPQNKNYSQEIPSKENKNISQRNTSEIPKYTPLERRYDCNTLSIVDNAQNGYNNGFRPSNERPPLRTSISRKYGNVEENSKGNPLSESVRFSPYRNDYERSRFGDYTYNFFLNAPMRGDVSEDWRYPPQYYYLPKFNTKSHTYENY